MGNSYAHRGARLAPALILTLLAVLAVIIVLGLTAGQASAYSTYRHGGMDTSTSTSDCNKCHTVSVSVPPTNADCQACHTGFTTAHTKGGVASTCWTCHAPGQAMATIKTPAGCGAAAANGACHGNAGHPGSKPTTCLTCHTATTSATDPGQSAHHQTAVTDVTVKPLLTIKLATSVKVKKPIKASGLAKSHQAGYVVTVLVQQKVGKKWVKRASKPAKWNQATSAWTFSYTPKAKGTWRMQASTPVVPGTNGNATAISAGKTAFKTFKVK